MNPKRLLLAAAVAGLLSTVGVSRAAVISDVVIDRLDFTAPKPAMVVAPMEIPRSYENETIRVSLTVDEQGRARNVELLDGQDPRLVKHLLPAVAQWQFEPAMKNGRPVAADIVLPVQLVASTES